VLVVGAGPIGLLVLLAARRAGAERVCITDILDGPLSLAKQLGADAMVNIAAAATKLKDAAQQADGFEVAFEVSGNPAGLASCLESVRPGGIVVQVGNLPAGRVLVAGNLVMAWPSSSQCTVRPVSVVVALIRSIIAR
jgi:L-idonate 5-dehydrogenase